MSDIVSYCSILHIDIIQLTFSSDRIAQRLRRRMSCDMYFFQVLRRPSAPSGMNQQWIHKWVCLILFIVLCMLMCISFAFSKSMYAQGSTGAPCLIVRD